MSHVKLYRNIQDVNKEQLLYVLISKSWVPLKKTVSMYYLPTDQE